MQLILNKDIDNLPFSGNTPKIIGPVSSPKSIEEWIELFPYFCIVDCPFHSNWRAAEKQNNDTEYRRLRVSVDLTDWMPVPQV